MEHVGLGVDYDGVDHQPTGPADVSRYPVLLRELAARGWSQSDLEGADRPQCPPCAPRGGGAGGRTALADHPAALKGLRRDESRRRWRGRRPGARRCERGGATPAGPAPSRFTTSAGRLPPVADLDAGGERGG
ncbi:membrane dipeptidase [Streptacidiphilus sp. PAMC 29251]